MCQRRRDGPSRFPLNGEAVALVGNQVGKHPTFVFGYKGAPITQVSTKACTVANLGTH